MIEEGVNMTNFKDFLEEQLKDDELRKEYERLKNNLDTVHNYINRYKRKYSQKEYIETPFGKSYGEVLFVNKGCSPISDYDGELACGHSSAIILLYDSGFVERKCPTCNRHETYYSLADAFVAINKTIDKRNTVRILQSAIYVEKENI
jgi:hypothetical protein